MPSPSQNPNPNEITRLRAADLDALEPALRDIDLRLAEHAASRPLPPGLADRVFDASVADLPRRGLRLAGTSADRRRATGWRRVGWSQVALAASLGLAFVVGASLLRGPALVSPPTAVALAASDPVEDIDWLARDAVADVDERVAHLLDTESLSSFSDVTPELESLIAALEM